MGINDQAILYRSKVLMVKSKINNLNSIGIDAKKYSEQLEKIETEVSEQVEKFQTEIKKEKLFLRDLNEIYNKGIIKLEELESRFQKYDNYLKGYSYCEYLDGKLDDEEMSEQLLDDYAKQLGNYINLINDTDTRDYAEEGKIVEKIYDTSYLIMKLEFAILGKSRIFEMTKENPVVAAFMNDCIERDIENLKKSGKDTKLINQTINKIRSNGINSTYLDETLITLIALKDDNAIISRIKDKLIELSSEIKSNSDKISSIRDDVYEVRSKMNDNIKQIHEERGKNTLEIAKRCLAGLLVASSLFGVFLLARRLARETKYKTTTETFSSVSGYSCEEDYEGEKKEKRPTKLYVYSLYEKHFGSYRRRYIEYDVSNISSECETLDDYLELNLDHAANQRKGYNDKQASEMTEEDFNRGVEYEVIKVVQDENDYESHTSVVGTILLTAIFTLILAAIEGSIIHALSKKDILSNLEDVDFTKRRLKEVLLQFKERLQEVQKLMDNNRELKNEFSEIYNNYKVLVETKEFDHISDGILIPDPQIELDRREERILKKVLKDKNLSS